MEWELWEVVIALVVAILAIRITATINVTELLKHRRERQLQSLQALCPHVSIEIDAAAERITIQGLAISPPGTIEWFCVLGPLSRRPKSSEQQHEVLDSTSEAVGGSAKEVSETGQASGLYVDPCV